MNRTELLEEAYERLEIYLPKDMPSKSIFSRLDIKDIEEIIQKSEAYKDLDFTPNSLQRPKLPYIKNGRITDPEAESIYKKQMHEKLSRKFRFLNGKYFRSIKPALYETLANIVENIKPVAHRNHEETDTSNAKREYSYGFN